MSELQDILDEQERVRHASFEKLRAQVDPAAILDLEGFTDALDHLARCQGHRSGLKHPITKAGLAAHFGFLSRPPDGCAPSPYAKATCSSRLSM